MNVESLLSLQVLANSVWYRRALPIAAALTVSVALVLVFAVVPNEQVMGAVQRIFYFHVGAAFACYLCLAVLLGAGACFLVNRKQEWDLIGEAAAAVALLFASIVLTSGMIWGHSAWNTWWRWEPRLVSFLVLWLILLSYTLLRRFADRNAQERSFAAVLGIVAAVQVPIVIFSISLLAQSEQLHPQVVAKQGLTDYRYVAAFVLSSLAMCITALWFVAVKAGSLFLRSELLELSITRPATDDSFTGDSNFMGSANHA